MAYTINKTLKTEWEFRDTFYVRLTAQVDIKWDYIKYRALRYKTKAAYEEGQGNNISLNCIQSESPEWIIDNWVSIPMQWIIEYNRETDGNDLLWLIHIAYKEILLAIEVNWEKLFADEDIVEIDMW